MQLAAAKGSEIEELLGRLSDVNDEMGSALSGAGDSRAHTLARHREIMVELTQARVPPAQPGAGMQGARRPCGPGEFMMKRWKGTL